MVVEINPVVLRFIIKADVFDVRAATPSGMTISMTEDTIAMVFTSLMEQY